MDIKEFNSVASSVAEEFIATELDASAFFPWSILKQNLMYELPVAVEPTFDMITEGLTKRTEGFMRTLGDELSEGNEILALERVLIACGNGEGKELLSNVDKTTESLMSIGGVASKEAAAKMAKAYHDYADEQDENLSYAEVLKQWALVSRADWLGDLTVYIRSEALKYGIPLEAVQNIIMNSNFTKLGEDGQPLKNADGKFLKGPNFIPPENHISALLFQRDELVDSAQEVIVEAEATRQVTLPLLEDTMSSIVLASGLSLESDVDYGLDEDDPAFESEPGASVADE